MALAGRLPGLYQRPRVLNLRRAALESERPMRRPPEPGAGTRAALRRRRRRRRGGMNADNDEVRIGRFTLDDLDEARALWEATDMWLRPSDGREQMALLLARDPDLHFAARDGAGRLVGTVLGGWDGRRAYVYHLAVAPDRQRQGIGGRLWTSSRRASAPAARSRRSCRSSPATRRRARSSPPAATWSRPTVSRGARSSCRAERRPVAAAELAAVSLPVAAG